MPRLFVFYLVVLSLKSRLFLVKNVDEQLLRKTLIYLDSCVRFILSKKESGKSNSKNNFFSSDETLSSIRAGRRLREEKKAKQRVIVMAIFVLLIIFLTFIMVSTIMEDSRPKPQLYILTNDSLEIEIDTQALLLRNEKTVDAPAGGILQAYISSGERTGINAPVARVLDSSAAEEYKTLKSINQQIAHRQLELLRSGDFDDVDFIQEIYERYDAQFKDYLYNLQKIALEEIYIDNLPKIDAELELLLEKRSEQFQAYDFQDAELENLLTERKNLETILANKQTYIYSPYSGVVSYLVDDFSMELDLSKLEDIDSSKIFFDDEQAVDDLNLDKKLNIGQDALTIIDGYEQYVLTAVHRDDAINFDKDELYGLEVPRENIKIKNVRLKDIRDDAANPDLQILTFKADTRVENLAHLRRIPIRIHLDSTRGLKVPVSALFKFKSINDNKEKGSESLNEVLIGDKSESKDKSESLESSKSDNSLEDKAIERASIMLINKGYVYAQEVDILYKDENYAVISSPIGAKYNLDDGTVIVQNPHTVSSGEKLTY